MNPLTARAIATFPPEIQAFVRAHAYLDEIDELVQNAARSLLETKSEDTVRSILKRARSGTRRRTQDPAYYGRSLDAADVAAGGAAGETGVKRKQFRARHEADLRVSKRTAQRAVKRQIERGEQGDLFGDDGSGDDDGSGVV